MDGRLALSAMVTSRELIWREIVVEVWTWTMHDEPWTPSYAVRTQPLFALFLFLREHAIQTIASTDDAGDCDLEDGLCASSV